MKLGRNILVGIVSSAWTGLVGLLVVPWYLKYLGIENYGLIGFFATTQALLQLLDMGLAPTMNREIARCVASGAMGQARNLLHTLAVVYWCSAVLIGLLVYSIAPFLASHWLQSAAIDSATLAWSITLMGLVVACKWPVALYQSALMGMQRLEISSSISAGMITLGNLGAVAVLAWVSPTVEAFFTWQALSALAQVAVMRWAAWRVVGSEGTETFDASLLRRIWRFSAGMSGIAIASILLTQLDKVLLSKLLSLEAFGKYALAGVVSSGLYVLLTPVFHVVYPRMASFVALGNTEDLLFLYKSGTRLLASVLLPIAITVALFSEDLVRLWTGDAALSASIAPIVSLLILGTACNGIMHFPYALQLANGVTWLPFTITTILATCLVPLIIVLTLHYGPEGSAAAWLAVNAIYVFFGTWLTHRILLKGHGMNWLLYDVGIPMIVSLAVIGTGKSILPTNNDYLVNLAAACGLGMLALLANWLALPNATISRFRQTSFGGATAILNPTRTEASK